MKKILIILTIITISFSCKKKVINGTYTVKGYLYRDCSKAIVKNYPLALMNRYYENNYPKYVTLATCTTDAAGYFEFTYSNPADGNIYINEAGTPYPGYINNLPIQNIDSLVVLQMPKATVNVKLQIINSYTTKDTLFIGGSNSSGGSYKIGPFYNGQLLSPFNYTLQNLEYNRNYMKSTIMYTIGMFGNETDSIINVMPCTNDTITITIK